MKMQKLILFILIFHASLCFGQDKLTKKAILVVDIQDDFTASNAKMPVDSLQAVQMIENLNRIIDKSKETEVTVIYIGNEYGKYDLLNIFRNVAALKGSDETKMDKRLHIVSKNYFSKHKGNAFSNPELDKFLKDNNITDVYIGGLYAEACIYATTKGAIRHKYTTTVLTDCIATKTEKNGAK
jgi:nicotinamidase-related amidase